MKLSGYTLTTSDLITSCH